MAMVAIEPLLKHERHAVMVRSRYCSHGFPTRLESLSPGPGTILPSTTARRAPVLPMTFEVCPCNVACARMANASASFAESGMPKSSWVKISKPFPLNRPSATFSPTGGESWDEGAVFKREDGEMDWPSRS